MKLALAPLQTYTDHHFRNAFQKVFSGADVFYAPYLKLNNDGSIKANTKVDVLPENNPMQPVVPQVMACTPSDFFTMANYLKSLGYTELNWNMGCPYPMVTNRNLGAGILNKPDLLESAFDQVFSRLDMQVGLKMRMGVESTEEILALIPLLNRFPLTEIIIHGRYARQLYTGTVDKERFGECVSLLTHPVVFNGDISTAGEAESVKREFPGISGIMIGRGALENPSLFAEITTGQTADEDIHRTKLLRLSEEILRSTSAANADKGYPLGKLRSYWEYFSAGLPDGKQLYRKLKKSSGIDEFFKHLDVYLS